MQLITAFVILISVWAPERIIFQHRYPFEDPSSSLYYQVDNDELAIVTFFRFPIAIFFVILPIAFILLLKRKSFRQSTIAKVSLLLSGIELSIWINSLITIIQLSNSLVSCDKLIIGKSLGCYIP